MAVAGALRAKRKGFCQMKEIETVEECCPHEDCIYRYRLFDSHSYVPICYYAVVKGEVRGCPISKCTRYIAGKRKRPRMTEDIYIEWEYQHYECTDDNLDT